MRVRELVLYRDILDDGIIEDALTLIDGPSVDEAGNYVRACANEKKESMGRFVGALLDLASRCAFCGNLWQAYITHAIAVSDNPYSSSCAVKGDIKGTLKDAACHDLSILRTLFLIDVKEFDDAASTSLAGLISDFVPEDKRTFEYDKAVSDALMKLRDALAAAPDDETFASLITTFYKENGAGLLGLHRAFSVERDASGVYLRPIANVSDIELDDLVGLESAKKRLIRNTEAFLEGRACNNCLLFGDAGTGKSSSVKGLLNRYYSRGLRMIELYKHQLKDLSKVMELVRNSNYRFIIFMDDLSFEESETQYKYLKAVMEGGLEDRPENILVYATSNRRHIVREKYSDRNDVDDELHRNDTVQEKLSLAYRFGETIYFSRPGKKEFDNIVKVLAGRYGITMNEDELLLEANRWELSHGGLSGRTAKQFLDMLIGG